MSVICGKGKFHGPCRLPEPQVPPPEPIRPEDGSRHFRRPEDLGTDITGIRILSSSGKNWKPGREKEKGQ